MCQCDACLASSRAGSAAWDLGLFCVWRPPLVDGAPAARLLKLHRKCPPLTWVCATLVMGCGVKRSS